MTFRRIPLATGVTLNVGTAGPEDGDPIILLHGFPESHRTWRDVVPALAQDHFVVTPDQRGYAASDKPQGVEEYRADRIIADLLALADALGIGRITLVGHDWGGAIAWGAALKAPDRVARMVIVNAPHPYIFQRSLIADEGQRAASQYITMLRNPAAEQGIAAIGLPAFFDRTMGKVADVSKLTAEDRQAYLDEWAQPGALTGMINWYRASTFSVPAPGEAADMPSWADGPFPPVTVPTLVIWGTNDTALLPVQLDRLEALVPHLCIERVEAGHFVPWEAPMAVAAAIKAFVAEG